MGYRPVTLQHDAYAYLALLDGCKYEDFSFPQNETVNAKALHHSLANDVWLQAAIVANKLQRVVIATRPPHSTS